MKNLNLLNTTLVVAYIVTCLLTLSAAIGSYQESEPHAGNILFTALAVMLVLGVALYFKFKPRLLKH